MNSSNDESGRFKDAWKTRANLSFRFFFGSFFFFCFDFLNCDSSNGVFRFFFRVVLA